MRKYGYAAIEPGCWENVKENIIDKYDFKVTSNTVRELSKTHKYRYDDKTKLFTIIPYKQNESVDEYFKIVFDNICDFLDKKRSTCCSDLLQAIYDYFDKKNKESKPAVIKTQKEFNISKPKYVNKPKELPKGQNVIITPYEEKKNSEVKPQETNKVLMYVPEYVKETNGKVTVETKAVEVPKEVIITPPPVAVEKPKEIQKEVQEVTNQVENQQQTQTVTTAQQQPVQYAKSKITISSIINNPIFSVFTYLDTNYRKKHPLPPSPFGSLVAADPDYTKPQETARSMFVDWDFCDSNYGNNVTKIDYIEYSTFKLFTNAEFLKFIGQYNQQPLFKVYFDQNDEHHLVLIAEDENGIIQIDHNRFLNQNNTNVKYNSRSK